MSKVSPKCVSLIAEHSMFQPGRPRRQGGDGFVILAGGGVYLVLDVGDVAHVADVLEPVNVAQQPIEYIEDYDGASVADMRAVINGRPADIEPHLRRIERLEGLL